MAEAKIGRSGPAAVSAADGRLTAITVDLGELELMTDTQIFKSILEAANVALEQDEGRQNGNRKPV